MYNNLVDDCDYESGRMDGEDSQGPNENGRRMFVSRRETFVGAGRLNGWNCGNISAAGATGCLSAVGRHRTAKDEGE